MDGTIVYGSLVSQARCCALAVGSNPETLLFVPSDEITEINLDLHLDASTRWQAVPIWSRVAVQDVVYSGRVKAGTLRRARDLEGELQLIREKLRLFNMDVVLFDGKRGWIVGIRPHQELHYDPQLRNWLCTHQQIQNMILSSVGRRVRYT